MEEEPKAPTDQEVAIAERISARRQITSNLLIAIFAGFVSVFITVIGGGFVVRVSYFSEAAPVLGGIVITTLVITLMTRRAITRPPTKIAHVEARVQAVFSNALDSVNKVEDRESV